MEFPPEWEIRPLDDFPSATCKSFSRPLGMECFLEMSGLIPGGFRFELGGTSELAVNIPALSVLGAEAQGKIALLPTPLTPPPPTQLNLNQYYLLWDFNCPQVISTHNHKKPKPTTT